MTSELSVLAMQQENTPTNKINRPKVFKKYHPATPSHLPPQNPPSQTPTSLNPIFLTYSSLLLLNFPILSTLSLFATLKLSALDAVAAFIPQASLAALTANDELTSLTSVPGGEECRLEAT